MNPILLEISLDDYQRIIFGEDLGPWFVLEIIFRTLFVYLLLIVSMRAMGKRMASQLSRLELVSLVSLAAAIGVPVLGTNEGLLPGVIIALVVVVSQRTISVQHMKNSSLEKKMLGDLEILVDQGIYQWPAMNRVTISKGRINAELRSEGIHHTGEVEKLIIESNGSFSLIKADEPRPGIPVIPEFDHEFISEIFRPSERKVCSHCGAESKKEQKRCTTCGHVKQTEMAVTFKKGYQETMKN